MVVEKRLQNVWMTARAAVLMTPEPSWASPLIASLKPGSHAFVITHEAESSIEGRRAGFELRDTVLVLSVGPHPRYAFLFRKPLEEPTVLAQLADTGSGVLNVADCRIGWGSDAVSVPSGRWPPNVLLVHGPECRKLGTRRVAATSIHGVATAIRRSGVHSEVGGHQTIGREQPVTGYADEDGLGTIAAYDCEPYCPVPMLDSQSGELQSGDNAVRRQEWKGYNKGLAPLGHAEVSYGDAGGASRYYPQFANDNEMFDWMQRLLGG